MARPPVPGGSRNKIKATQRHKHVYPTSAPTIDHSDASAGNKPLPSLSSTSYSFYESKFSSKSKFEALVPPRPTSAALKSFFFPASMYDRCTAHAQPIFYVPRATKWIRLEPRDAFQHMDKFQRQPDEWYKYSRLSYCL